MLATAFGPLHCKGLPLPPADLPVQHGKENEDWDANVGDMPDWMPKLKPVPDGFYAQARPAQQQEQRETLFASDDEGHALDLAAQDDDTRTPEQRSPEKRAPAVDDFERRLQANVGDMVGLWCEYVEWVAQHMPKSQDELDVLARACYSLMGDPSLKNDIRYLRLWVRHAALLPDPERVFALLQAEGIGTSHALFYEAIASDLERQHKFQEAEAQYQKGFDRGAEPSQRLQCRFQEFQRRMAKRAARERQKQREATVQQESLKNVIKSTLTSEKVSPLASVQQQRPKDRLSRPGPSVGAETGKGHQEGAGWTPRSDEPSSAGRGVPRWSSSTFAEEEELPLQDQAFIAFTPQEEEGLEDVSVEELQAARVLARLGAGGAGAAGAAGSGGAGGVGATPTHAPGRAGRVPSRSPESRLSVANMTQEVSNGLRAFLSESRFSRGRSSHGSLFDPFEDPTYTAELAQKEVLALLACDPHHENYEPVKKNSVLKPLIRVGRRSAKGAEAPSGPNLCAGFEIFDEADLG